MTPSRRCRARATPSSISLGAAINCEAVTMGDLEVFPSAVLFVNR